MPIELQQVLDAERLAQRARNECEGRGALRIERFDLDRLDSEIGQEEQAVVSRFGSPLTRSLWWPQLLIYSARVFCGRAVAFSKLPLFAASLLVAVLGLGLGLLLGAGIGLSQQLTIFIGATLAFGWGFGFAGLLLVVHENFAKQRWIEILAWQDDFARSQSQIYKLRDHRRALGDLLKLRSSFEALNQNAGSLRREFESIANQLAMANWRAMRGIEFENFLATVLRHHGFEVSMTKKTGDQGIDLIATSQTLRLGIQVKGYVNSVGNDAVQQAHSGKSVYECTHSVVITNSVFTQSAKELAKIVDCLLVDESQIPDLIAGRILSAHSPAV